MAIATARLDDIPPRVEPEQGYGEWRAIRDHFGIRAFGVNAWVARNEGDEVIEEHDELSGGAAGHEEVYLVLEGEATFSVGDETLDAGPGTLVHVADPGTRRKAVARTAGTTVLAIGAIAGQAFDVSPWERKYER